MITQDKVEERVADFVDACRREGVKATHQRVEILRELAGTREHPDAETIYVGVRRRIPTISLDTVYRTLRMLEEKGVIARVGSITDRARFDANNEQHHHFVCTECGLVRDLHDGISTGLTPPTEASQIGSVDCVYVEFRGRCSKCRTTG
jgi:Fur family peroxide stress response transcriptional regulator